MLSHHLDVHETDNSGRTALHIAAYTGDLKCVEMLLKYGASVNALDQLHHTPLFRACEMGYTDVVNVLKQSKWMSALSVCDMYMYDNWFNWHGLV